MKKFLLGSVGLAMSYKSALAGAGRTSMFAALLCCGAFGIVAPANADVIVISDGIKIGVDGTPTYFPETAEPFDYTTTFVSVFPFTLNLTETSSTRPISDIVYTDSNLIVHFASADENGNFLPTTTPGPFNVNYAQETGDWQEVCAGNYCPGIFVQSDVAAVPGPIAGAGLPGGLILACGGLLAVARRRRKVVA
jgi:hypothetical protein